MPTLGDIRRSAARQLANSLRDDDSPALDARLLVAAAVGMQPERLALDEERPVTPAEQARVEAFLARRLSGEPVARILGVKEFWGLPFRLDAETLVPRPDSETVVEAALASLPAAARNRMLRIADIGTGTGALLLALLSELPNAVGIGVDLSEAAARMARNNAQTLGFAERTLFIRGHWAAAIGPVDVLLSNPPYIRSAVIETLGTAVRDFDPRLALDGGEDGLAPYRDLLGDLDRVLAPGGGAFLEIGYDQGSELVALAASHDFESRLHRDLAGRDRVVELHRRPAAARSSQFE